MSELRLTGVGRPPEPPPLPAAMRRVRGRIATALLAAHAIAPEDAVDFAAPPGGAAALAELRATGVVRAVADGRLWLDLVAYHQREGARSRAATIGLLGLAVIVAVGLMLLYR